MTWLNYYSDVPLWFEQHLVSVLEFCTIISYRHFFRAFYYNTALIMSCKVTLFVCVEVLRPCQQLRSCRAGQLPINTVPGQA